MTKEKSLSYSVQIELFSLNTFNMWLVEPTGAEITSTVTSNTHPLSCRQPVFHDSSNQTASLLALICFLKDLLCFKGEKGKKVYFLACYRSLAGQGVRRRRGHTLKEARPGWFFFLPLLLIFLHLLCSCSFFLPSPSWSYSVRTRLLASIHDSLLFR